MNKVLLLGASGYVGTAFRKLLESRNVSYIPVSRRDVNYLDLAQLRDFLALTKPSFLINAAGYTGKPNVDACEIHRADCIAGNALLPGIVQEACSSQGVAWGHVSSGCIFTGTREDGEGFHEKDPPNFSFRTNNCSFYSGCKALGEECLWNTENTYVWRLRIPFNHVDSNRNYLSKVMRYETLLEATNSISHLDEFVRACWLCWEKRVPYGIYNVVNTGAVTTREVVEHLIRELKLTKRFQFFDSEDQFMKVAAKTPRSNCVLQNRKLQDVGIEMSDVHDAIIQSLRDWQSETPVQ